MPIKVRLFCDWDDTSEGLAFRLKQQSYDFKFEDIDFVDDESYDCAVFFNFSHRQIKKDVPKVGLLLEPPEICQSTYPEYSLDMGSSYYSFCSGTPYKLALGLGFATVPGSYESPTPFNERKNKACMIVSNKRLTPYHHKRLEVFQELVSRKDLDIHFYGRGMASNDNDARVYGEIPPFNKQEIISNYTYCIDFENANHHTLTDKYFDPIICGTIPITNSQLPNIVYLNCLLGYRYTSFDSKSPKEIADQIEEIISTPIGNPKAEEKMLKNLKWDIIAGRFSLGRWITDRIKEL